MKAMTLDLLANVEHLRAYADVLACDLGRSELVVLTAIVSALEREQRRRSDDIHEILRLGLVRQVAEKELARLVAER